MKESTNSRRICHLNMSRLGCLVLTRPVIDCSEAVVIKGEHRTLCAHDIIDRHLQLKLHLHVMRICPRQTTTEPRANGDTTRRAGSKPAIYPHTSFHGPLASKCRTDERVHTRLRDARTNYTRAITYNEVFFRNTPTDRRALPS
jgi:hypothetical protein